MEVGIIFQIFKFSIAILNRAKEMLNFRILTKRAICTPVFNLNQYVLHETNGNILLNLRKNTKSCFIGFQVYLTVISKK